MVKTKLLSRRTVLGAACSLAASPLATPLVFAATPGENRLVVIVLRGALDGLALAEPYGDPAFAAHRQGPREGAQDLDGFFALGKPFDGLMPLWRAGELGIVHAVSTPYRNKRSHFDGQDMLESGGTAPGTNRDGWLNRALSLIPGAETETAIAVGRDHMLILDGQAPSGSWSPGTNFRFGDDERMLVSYLYADDPLFAQALEQAEMLSAESSSGRGQTGSNLARFAAQRLNGSARIAAFSIGGWDTHRRQSHAIKRPAGQLTDALLTLKSTLGKNWDRTAVLCMTEFGRTARLNGSAGSDHGTGGAMILAGGAIRGGKVYGKWPGLAPSDLYQDRDLRATDDVRRWAGWALAGLFGVDGTNLSRTVFPGLDLGSNPRMLV